MRDDGGSDRVAAIILHDQADRYAESLSQMFPEVTFLPCPAYDKVAAVIRSEGPQLALAFKAGAASFPRGPLVEPGGPMWVHVGGAGIEHMQPWDPGRVQVTNSSGIHGDIMAQYVLCAMLMANQHTRVYFRQQGAKTWRKHLSRSIEGQTLAVVGFGHVGASIGTLARANGMRVLGVRSSPQPSPAADEVVGLDRLHDVLGECDHVAITLPLTEATRGLIGRRELAALRPETHFINVSRGGIVDEGALHEALTSRAIACATLDVFAREPLPPDSPFWSLDNVVLTPHSSSDIEGWQQRAIDLFSDNLRRWLDGRPLRNVVDPARGY